MRLSSRKLERGTQVELQMTSMIDVVFLLLIFFMTAAAFIPTERHLDPTLQPKSKSAARREQDIEPTVVEIVKLESGVFVYKLGGNEIASQKELIDKLKMKRGIDRSILLGPDGGGNSVFPSADAFVRVRDDSPFAMAAGAIQACMSAGYNSVSYVPMSESAP